MGLRASHAPGRAAASGCGSVYDVQAALHDLACQVRACRARDGLTLQQLSTRCGVAASTIHKIETQQMVPTVSVLLKLARGLGRRPQDLIRDLWTEGGEQAHREDGPSPATPAATAPAAVAAAAAADAAPTAGASAWEPDVAAWRFDFACGPGFPPLLLESGQRAILFIEGGAGELSSPSRRRRLRCGGCVEIAGERFAFASDPADPARALLIVSPAGRIAQLLGPPNASSPDA